MKIKSDVVLTIPISEKKHFELKLQAVNGGGYAYYDTKKEPANPFGVSKAFIVHDGQITGFFNICEVLWEGSWENAKQIHKATLCVLESVGNPEYPFMRYVFDEWTPIKPIKKTGFQGLRYRDFNYEELNGEEEKV